MSTTLLPGPRPWPARDAPIARTFQVGDRSYQFVPPSFSDPRIHLSMVILTILFIGIGWLGFRVSVAQILVTLVVCGVIEVATTYRRNSMFVWPASAFQTATSTALLFRVIGTENGDYWTMRGWYLFAAVGALGLLTKYVIRFRSGHVFNPSNIALVAAFLVLGSERVEPLDFWWAPFDWPMLAAYAVIVIGGLFICSRLRLLGLGAALWVSLAAGLAVLALADHSITTRWSFTPITGAHFWWIIMTSPEILIFLFFMITDPRTVPCGRVARIAYGSAIGVVSAALDRSVGHRVRRQGRAALRVGDRVRGASALRPVLPSCRIRGGSSRPIPRANPVGRPRPAGARRRPATCRDRGSGDRGPGDGDHGCRMVCSIDDCRRPRASRNRDGRRGRSRHASRREHRPECRRFERRPGHSQGAQELAATLAWNLRVEAEAIATGDASLLPAIADGERLHEIQAVIESGSAGGQRVIPTYTFDSLDLHVVYPGGLQRGANAGLAARGTVEEVVRSESGEELERRERPFAVTFSLRRTTSGRWLNTDTLPYDTSAQQSP